MFHLEIFMLEGEGISRQVGKAMAKAATGKRTGNLSPYIENYPVP